MKLGLYTLTQDNDLCSDSLEHKSIETLEGCQHAVGFVRSIIKDSNIVVFEEEESEYPKGCYFQEFSSKMYFNTHSTGHRQRYSREVCILEGR